jgi:CheY-like chemotaxis protein
MTSYDSSDEHFEQISRQISHTGSILLPDMEVRLRILIVDDEPYNLLGLRVILEAADESGFIKDYIDEATNGFDALRAVKKAALEGNFMYGLIFMDSTMPIMDGFTATEKIRKFLRASNLQ